MIIGSEAYGSAAFGQGIGPVQLTRVQCVGSEERLADCPSLASTTGCYHIHDVGVKCHVQTGNIVYYAAKWIT